MKPTHFSRYLKFALFLAILCSFTTAYAYDFQLDGIFYNITSTNTVEVTYKDTNYESCSGEVIIPSTITYNNKTYTVTAIGDSAFYNDYDVIAVTIPESVTSIGEAAFFSSSLTVITCLATTPPELGVNCFGHHSYGYNRMPWYENQQKKEYEGQIISVDILSSIGWDLFLYVPEESYEDYKLMNEINHYFSFVIKIGAGVTQFDEDGADIHTCYVLYNGRYPDYPMTWSYWDEGMTFDYTDPDWGSSVDVYAYSYAIKEGKEPTDCYISWSEHYSYYDHLFDLVYAEVWTEDEDVSDYDIYVDGVYYKFLGGDSLEVVSPDVHVHIIRANEYYTYFVVYNTIYYEYNGDESGAYRDGYYDGGQMVIPSTVTYNGNSYNVTSIAENAFEEFCREYVYEVVDYSSQHNKNESNTQKWGATYDIYQCYLPPCSFTSLSIPTSIKSVGESALSSCGIRNFHLTGEGEWSAGALDVAVQRLDIASDITAIPGLQVNPREVYCYAKVPPTCDANTFIDYTGTLHVPESSLAAYFTAPYWCNF